MGESVTTTPEHERKIEKKNRLFARTANREATGTDRLFARAGNKGKGTRELFSKKNRYQLRPRQPIRSRR